MAGFLERAGDHRSRGEPSHGRGHSAVTDFAHNDARGQQVLDACRRVGLPVPEQVAVLGVDNDEVLCALSPPPMSSIALNPQRTGLLRCSNGQEPARDS